MEHITIGQIAHFLELLVSILTSVGVISTFVLKKVRAHVSANIQGSLKPLYAEIAKINKNTEINRKTNEEGMKCLLRNDILYVYTKCRDFKQITMQEKESINHSFELYKKIGGNSFVADIVEEMNGYEISK